METKDAANTIAKIILIAINIAALWLAITLGDGPIQRILMIIATILTITNLMQLSEDQLSEAEK